MTPVPKRIRDFFCALVVVQGALLLIAGIAVSSVNLPFTTLRFDATFVMAGGLMVLTVGLLSWKLPIGLAINTATSVATLVAVFAFGYRPIEAGDVSLHPDLTIRTWQSENEWTEVRSRADALLGWSNRPNVTSHQINRDFTVSYGIDANGWRRMPTTVAPPPAPEVWFLGCSFTFGTGVEDTEAYPYRLAEHAWPSFQVRNYSTSGWGTVQAYLTLKRQLESSAVAPRVVVYGWINNHRQRNYLRRSWFEKNRAANFARFDVVDGQLHSKGVVPASEANLEDGPELDEAEYRVTEALIRAMAALSRERGIPFVFLVLDPTDKRILDAARGNPGLHILDVSRRSTAVHPHEGHPAPNWHQAIAHAIAADPLLARVTGLPQLQSPDAIADAPMREWQLSIDRNSRQRGNAGIRYPDRERTAMRVELLGALPDDPWKILVKRSDINIQAGRTYTFKMRVRADGARSLPIVLSRGRAPWGDLGLHTNLALSTTWQTAQRTFVATDDDPAASLILVVGGSRHPIEIDGVPTLTELSDAEAIAALARPTWTLAAPASTGAVLSNLADDADPPFRVDIASLPNDDIWAIQLQFDGLDIKAGEHYTIELRARSPGTRALQYALSRSQPDWENLGLWGELKLTPEWQTARTTFIAPKSDAAGRLILALGSSTESVEVASVRLLVDDRDLLSAP